MTPDQIKKITKLWYFPQPKGYYETDTAQNASDINVSQQAFYDQYHPSGHKIFDPAWYNDIPMYDSKKKLTGYHYVNRVSIPIQKDSITIVLAHLLGNKTRFIDSTVGENKSQILSQYKEFWEQKNMEVARYELIKSILTVGDGALLFYKDKNVLKWKVFSFLDGERIYAVNDKFGEMAYFSRFYSMIDEEGIPKEHCDIIDSKNYATYKQCESGWGLVSNVPHGFKQIPVVYYFRKSGAFWSHVQTDIDNLELMVSRVSEDNRFKAKSRYHLKTDNPNAVQMTSAGNSDIVITDEQGDFKMVAGADISTQFKFEYDMLLEFIYNSLGMVYPKSKSSGDMPTGSMKMMFFPTERVVFDLIQEFNSLVDRINTVFKEGMIYEHPDLSNELLKLNVSASIKMFTPQDEAAWNTMVGQSKAQGIVSTQTAAENCTISSPDEVARIESEQAKEIAQQQVEINPVQ